MEQIFSAFQNYTMIVCVCALAAICAGVFAAQMVKAYGTAWKRTCSVGMMVFFIGATIYGGGKAAMELKDKTSTDDGIDLYSFKVSESNVVEVVSEEVSTTNYVGTFLTLAVADTSSAPKPIWFRDSTYNQWTNLTAIAEFNTTEPVLDADKSGNGTNVYVWVSSNWTNNFTHTYWYIGTNLPAVDVDVTDDDYIIIDEFCMTSKKVHIKFHLNSALEYPEGTEIYVERLTGDRGDYEVVDTFPAEANGTYVWNGFAVGKRTRWRLHISVTKSE